MNPYRIVGILIFFLTAKCGAQTTDTSGSYIGSVVTFSSGEISPGFAGGWGSSWYSGELAMNVSVLFHDPYNGNKTSVSPMGLFTFAGSLLAGQIYSEQEGPSFRNILFYIIYIPLVALNSRHHFWLHGDPWPATDAPVRASVFVVSRFDLYGSDVQWARYAPGIGIEIDFALSTANREPAGVGGTGLDISRPSVAFDIAVEKPFDNVSDQFIFFSNGPRLFAGLRYYFTRASLIRFKQ